MEYTDIKYGVLLSSGQLDFLRDDNQGFHRMEALATFASLAGIEPAHYECKNFSADIDKGQFAASTVELARRWNCDRKTATKVVRMFNEVGMLTSEPNNRTTIHTIHCLAFWVVKCGDRELTIKNPHYVRAAAVTEQKLESTAPGTTNDTGHNASPIENESGMANPTIPNNGEGSSAAVQTEVSNVDIPAVQCDGMTKGVPMPDGKAPKELENVFPGDADTYSGVNDLSSEQEDEYSDESGDGQLDEVNDDADSDDSGNEAPYPESSSSAPSEPFPDQTNTFRQITDARRKRSKKKLHKHHK